jgi:tyrosyl-tRNA synthetase
MAAISLFRQLPRPQPYVCARCIRTRKLLRPPQRAIWAARSPDRDRQWKQKAERIRAGVEGSMLDLLEKRGFVKDVAGSVHSIRDAPWVLIYTAVAKLWTGS